MEEEPMYYKGLAFALIVLTCLSASLFGQTSATGGLVGTVTDASKAVVPGASVEATQKATSATRSTVTDHNGTYRFDLLSAGIYSVRVPASGFAKVVLEDVVGFVGRKGTVDLSLTVKGLQVTGVVTGEDQHDSDEPTTVGLI